MAKIKTKFGGVHYNYICLEHRRANKRGGLCPECGEKMICIGTTIEVPRRQDKDGWKKLEKKFETSMYPVLCPKTKLGHPSLRGLRNAKKELIEAGGI